MEKTYLKINPADNVAVAIMPLKAGETICVDDKEIVLKTDIPAGHKVTLKDSYRTCYQGSAAGLLDMREGNQD